MKSKILIIFLIVFIACGNENKQRINVDSSNELLKSKDNEIDSFKTLLSNANDSTLFNHLLSLVQEIKFEKSLKRTQNPQLKYLRPKETIDITIGLNSKSNNELDEFKRIFLKINLKPRLIPSIINVYDEKKKVNFTFNKSDNVIFDTAEFVNFSISVKSKMSLFNNRIIVLVITISSGIGMKGHNMFLVSFHPNGSAIDCIEWLDSFCGESSIEPKVDSKKDFHFRCTECESSFYKEEFKVQKEYILDYSVRINEKGNFSLSNYTLSSVSMKNN